MSFVSNCREAFEATGDEPRQKLMALFGCDFWVSSLLIYTIIFLKVAEIFLKTEIFPSHWQKASYRAFGGGCCLVMQIYWFFYATLGKSAV
jgi:hypothetical protein